MIVKCAKPGKQRSNQREPLEGGTWWKQEKRELIFLTLIIERLWSSEPDGSTAKARIP
jgi:hypothetical protein